MALISKFFRVATEGDTTDGRVIEQSWIQQMADSYDKAKYGARVWLEHIRGLVPGSPFDAYGDVVALEARKVEDGKLALFAQIEPLPSLIALNKAGQKLYSSIEISHDFANSGKAYLMGLAVTDSPASLGTEMLAFSAQKPDATPLSGRKQHKDNLFTAAQEVSFEFVEEPEKVSLSDRVRQLFSKSSHQEKQVSDQGQDMAEAIEIVVGHIGELEKKIDGFSDKSEYTKLEQSISSLSEKLSSLEQKLADEDANLTNQRPPATGGNGVVLTDC